MQAIEKENDDLTKIPGIKAARKLWLAEVFDVHTYADLAKLSADDIEAQLKADGKPYKRSEIEVWPHEAAKLAARSKMVIDQNSRQTEPNLTNFQSQKTESENNASTPETKEEQWQQVAYFNITFLERRVKDRVVGRKTIINYHEADENAEWDGFETERISQWIHKQAGDKLRQEIQEAPAAEPETEVVKEEALPARMAISVSGLHLYQPAGKEIALASGKNGRSYTGIIQADKHFAAETEFEIGELAAVTIGNREIPYRVQFYTQDRSNRDKVHLGDAKPGLLTGSKTSYSKMLGGITLPSGSYRLRVVVIAESEDVVPGYLELPLLRVV